MSNLSKQTTEPATAKTAKRTIFRRACAVFSSLAAVLVLLNWGTKAKFVTRYYEIADNRIHDEVRIALVCDLHGAQYGKDHGDLLAALEQEAPHAVLLLGDIFDQHGIKASTVDLLSTLASRFSCYFIPGNHEYQSGQAETILSLVRKAGIPILAGSSSTIQVQDTRVDLFGADDGRAGKSRQLRQIAQAGAQREDAVYSILAVHVPNAVESYLPYGFDLILSGHTHGGQIVIPGLLNGLYAPGQGFFPKYGGGRYDFGKQTLIISRGLSQRPYWLPRLGNPPEICFVTLKPTGK